jgi:hypothetical protein
VVASFQDSDPAGTVTDYSATIDWGDGQTSTSPSVFDNGSGGFDVVGSHTYAAAGIYSINVTVNDVGGASVTATGNGEVGRFSLMEEEPFYGVVANWNGSDANSTVAIDWGDGQTSAGTLHANPSGGFDVFAWQTYAEEGFYTLRVTVTASDSTVTTLTNYVYVADAPLVADFPITVQATEGETFHGLAGSFLDGNPNAAAGDFTATIDWGDGHVSDGTVTPNTNGSSDDIVTIQTTGGFDVNADTTFDAEGTYSATITVTDQGGSTTTIPATVRVADAPPRATARAIQPTEGTAFSGEVAWFTDADTNATAGDYTATITWGDGQTSAGAISPNGSDGFRVTGSNTYAEDGSYPLGVTITNVTAGLSTTVSETTVVDDAALTPQATTLSVSEGASYSGTVGSFQDANSSALLGDFTATIDWGDGGTSTGTVTSTGSGTFAVSGSHTYADRGVEGIAVTVTDQGGVTTQIDSSARVADVPANVTPQALTLTEGVAFSGTVATFADPTPDLPAGDFTATIDWGDGQTSTGTVAENEAGGFVVEGSHTYLGPNTDTLSAEVTDDLGQVTSLSEPVVVKEASLTGSGASLATATPGVPFTGEIASLQDGDPEATPSDLTLAITWDDGITSAGVLVNEGGGAFDIEDTHTFTTLGTHTASVTVTDPGLAPLPISAVVQVVANTSGNSFILSPAPGSLGATEGQSFSGRLATFTTSSLSATAGDFTATINWGDGATSNGTPDYTISGGNGTFAIDGTHTFGEEGGYTIAIAAGATNVPGGQTQDAMVVAAVPPTTSPATIQVTELSTDVSSPNDSFAGAVATFSDGGTKATAGNYTAVIDWGDGFADSGSITSDGRGHFSVNGQHGYAEEGTGSYPITVYLRDEGHALTVIHSQAVVADAPLTATAYPQAGGFYGGDPGGNSPSVLASFDEGAFDPLSGFHATIDWGDGTTGAGLVLDSTETGQTYWLPHRRYLVEGDHFYGTAFHQYTGGITISDGEGSSAVVPLMGEGSRPLGLLPDPSLQITPVNWQATEGQSFTTTLATFTDNRSNDSVHDYDVEIDWGDGTTDGAYGYPSFLDHSVLLTWSGNAATLTGTRAYSEDGTFKVTITIKDLDDILYGGDGFYYNSFAAATSSAVVGQAPISNLNVTATGVPITATEGQLLSNVVLATFSTEVPLAQLQVSVNWGDSDNWQPVTPSLGVVRGSHVYTEAGSYWIRVAVGGAITSATATVSDQPWSNVPVSPISATAGQAFSDVVAGFSDADTAETANEYVATIAWGDGSSSLGAVEIGDNGQRQVNGTHTFTHPGSFVTRVVIKDEPSSFVTPPGQDDNFTTLLEQGTATVSASGPSTGGVQVLGSFPVAATEGIPVTQALATFQTLLPQNPCSDESASIDWGDGSTTTGGITHRDGGLVSVSGSHTYAEEGDYAVKVSYNTATAFTSALVADQPLSLQMRTLPTTGTDSGLNNVIVATFTDSDPTQTPRAYSAWIDWGDESPDSSVSNAASVTGSHGHFYVQGSHQYTSPGTYTVTVIVQDGAGQVVQVSGTATVLNATAGLLTGVDNDFHTGVAPGVPSVYGPYGPGGIYGPQPVWIPDATGASVQWGDGTPDASYSAFSALPYDSSTVVVGGSHVYLQQGSYPDHLAVADDNLTKSADGTIGVADGALTVVTSAPFINGSVNGGSALYPLGIFADTDPTAQTSDFAVTIDWGDGSAPDPTAQVTALSNGTFAVSGSHLFLHGGTESVLVQIQDSAGGTNGSSTSFLTQAFVPMPAVTVQVPPFRAAAGFSTGDFAVATLTNIDDLAHLQVRITWGDGTSQQMTGQGLQDLGNGSYVVTSPHTYRAAGTYPVTVTATYTNDPRTFSATGQAQVLSKDRSE